MSKVTILGPNLPTQGETFHVHAAGCADINKARVYAQAKRDAWTGDFPSIEAVAEDVYDGPISDHEGDDDFDLDAYVAGQLVPDFKVFPCVTWDEKPQAALALAALPEVLPFEAQAAYDIILAAHVEAFPAKTHYASREQWLQHFVDLFRPYFLDVANTELPETIYVSVGWPSQRALSAKSRRVGECWHNEGTPHIFISPLLEDEVEILGVLIHELVHASGQSGHGAGFKKVAVAVGLEGKMTSTTISARLEQYLRDLLENSGIGEIPDGKLKATMRPGKKQTTRLLKVQCVSGECGYVARVTRTWLETVGPPICPCNGESMEPA